MMFWENNKKLIVDKRQKKVLKQSLEKRRKKWNMKILMR